eukprot:gene40836-50531_t
MSRTWIVERKKAEESRFAFKYPDAWRAHTIARLARIKAFNMQNLEYFIVDRQKVEFKLLQEDRVDERDALRVQAFFMREEWLLFYATWLCEQGAPPEDPVTRIPTDHLQPLLQAASAPHSAVNITNSDGPEAFTTSRHTINRDKMIAPAHSQLDDLGEGSEIDTEGRNVFLVQKLTVDEKSPEPLAPKRAIESILTRKSAEAKRREEAEVAKLQGIKPQKKGVTSSYGLRGSSRLSGQFDTPSKPLEEGHINLLPPTAVRRTRMSKLLENSSETIAEHMEKFTRPKIHTEPTFVYMQRQQDEPPNSPGNRSVNNSPGNRSVNNSPARSPIQSPIRSPINQVPMEVDGVEVVQQHADPVNQTAGGLDDHPAEEVNTQRQDMIEDDDWSCERSAQGDDESQHTRHSQDDIDHLDMSDADGRHMDDNEEAYLESLSVEDSQEDMYLATFMDPQETEARRIRQIKCREQYGYNTDDDRADIREREIRQEFRKKAAAKIGRLSSSQNAGRTKEGGFFGSYHDDSVGYREDRDRPSDHGQGNSSSDYREDRGGQREQRVPEVQQRAAPQLSRAAKAAARGKAARNVVARGTEAPRPNLQLISLRPHIHGLDDPVDPP